MHWLAVVWVAVFLLASHKDVLAHDQWGIANPSIAVRSEITPAILSKIIQSQPDDDTRYVFERALLWSPGSTLKVCFYGGSPDQRQRVLQAAATLLNGQQINLSMDFGQPFQDCPKNFSGRPHEMRISFNDGCCAAYIGRVSLSAAVVAEGPNIFIAGPPDQGTIIHEIMHALGVHHEHQSPAAGCESEFDIQSMATAYGWSEAKVRANVKSLNANSNRFVWSSTYDPSSIMKYYFAPEWLKGGVSSPCYSMQAQKPSRSDYDGLRRAYPASFDVASHKSKVTKARSAISTEGVPAELLSIINDPTE